MQVLTNGPAPVLRDYQKHALSELWKYWREGRGRAPVIVAPPGAGKSHIIAGCIQAIRRKNSKVRILLLTHRRELLQQDRDKIIAYCPEIDLGIYSAGMARKDISTVTCAQIQSWANLREWPEYDLVIIDEAHLVPIDENSRYRKVLTTMADANSGIRIVGLTATPYRLDQGLLFEGEQALFDGVAYEIDIQMLIERDPPVMVRPVTEEAADGLDLGNVKKTAGEFRTGDMDRETLRKRNSIAEQIVERSRGRKGLMVFCAGVDGAEGMAEQLRQKGMNAKCVVGNTPDRQQILDEFGRRELFALTSCDVLTHGVDYPHADTVALVRATTSTSLYVQMVGRGLRVDPGKQDCLVLDFGENLARHGPLNNLRINDPADDEGDGEAPQKNCPRCETTLPNSIRICSSCGYEFPQRLSEQASVGELIGDELLLPVNRVEYRRHKKRVAKGRPVARTPDTIRVIYTYAGYRQVSEWLCPDHKGYPKRIWLQRREELGARAWNLRQAEREWKNWRKPTSIQVGRDPKNPKFLRVIRRVYDDGQQVITGDVSVSDALALTEFQPPGTFDSKGRSLLHFAIESSVRVEVATALVARGYDVNGSDKSGATPLHLAVSNGNAKIANVLVQHGSNVEDLNGEGLAPLHLAAMKGLDNCVDLLLSAGAEVNILSKEKYVNTPLMKAAIFCSRESTIARLCREGALPSQRVGRWTALGLAARWARGRKTIAEMVKWGGNLAERTSDGKTLLHLAAENPRSPKPFLYLRESGLDPLAKDQYGTTALQIAQKNTKLQSNT